MAWLSLALVLLVGNEASAQTFTDMGQVLGPDGTVSFASLSVGSPSITWDSKHDQLIMIFESRTPMTHANCAKGVWALGMATSTDGLSWTIEPTRVVMPRPASGNGFACVAAHPAAIYTNAGANGKVQVYWKAESNTNCVGNYCEYTGIGRAVITLKASGGLKSVSIQAGAVLAFPNNRYGGFPRAVKLDSKFYLTTQLYPNVYSFDSTVPSSFGNSALAFDPTDAAYSSYTWVTDEFMAPSIVCNDSPMEFGLFLGSRDLEYGAVASGAIGKAISSDFATWYLGSTSSVSWTGDDTFRSFDVIRLDTNEYLMYYSKKDGSGNSTIHLAATDTGFDFATDTPVGKICTSSP